LALLPVFAACAPAAPPAQAPRTGAEAEDVPPVLGLLAERERLALQPRQVEAIESIARDWESRNDALRREMGAVKGRGPNPLRIIHKQARNTVKAMAENNRRAAHAVGQVLNADQRARMCTVQRLRHEMAAVTRSVKSAAPSATQARPAAHARASREPARVWPWCASAPVRQQAGSAN
jgi:hypothetical protein